MTVPIWTGPKPRTTFKSKSEEKRVKTLLEPKNDLQTNIAIWPVNNSSFGVAIRLNSDGLRSRLCGDKAAIIKFLDEVL